MYTNTNISSHSWVKKPAKYREFYMSKFIVDNCLLKTQEYNIVIKFALTNKKYPLYGRKKYSYFRNKNIHFI